MRRFNLLAAFLSLIVVAAPSGPARGQQSSGPMPNSSLIGRDQRVVIVMVDGLGVDYVEQSSMPVLKGLMGRGFSKTVRGVMPAVTNTNNASICCGTWPEEHGITGNSFFDEETGQVEYMESAKYLRVPTLFERAAILHAKSALLTAKKKTVALLIARRRDRNRGGRPFARGRPPIRYPAADL